MKVKIIESWRGLGRSIEPDIPGKSHIPGHKSSLDNPLMILGI